MTLREFAARFNVDDRLFMDFQRSLPNFLATSASSPQYTDSVSDPRRRKIYYSDFKCFTKWNSIELDPLDEKRNSMAGVICKEFVDLLVKALEKGCMEEKHIDSFIGDNHFKRSEGQPSTAIYNFDNLRKKRNSSAKKRRNVGKIAKKAWFEHQKNFTQFASGFYDTVFMVCGTEEERDELLNACVKLGMKMIQESDLETQLKQVGQNIFSKLTTKSVAVELHARVGNAEKAMTEIQQSAHTSYVQRMALMLESVTAIDKETLEDIHHIAKNQVIAAAFKSFQELQRRVKFTEKVGMEFVARIRGDLEEEYLQIALGHQGKILDGLDEVMPEIDRLQIIYVAEVSAYCSWDGMYTIEGKQAILRKELVAQLKQFVAKEKGFGKVWSWKRCLEMFERSIEPIRKNKWSELGILWFLKIGRKARLKDKFARLSKAYRRDIVAFLNTKPYHLEISIRRKHDEIYDMAAQKVQLTKRQSVTMKTKLEYVLQFCVDNNESRRLQFLQMSLPGANSVEPQ